MKTTVKIFTTVLHKEIWLGFWNDKCIDPDYARQEYKLAPGNKCHVLVETVGDGRVYFFFFALQDDKLFTNISMTDADGKWYPNCGMSDYMTTEKMIKFAKTNPILPF